MVKVQDKDCAIEREDMRGPCSSVFSISAVKGHSATCSQVSVLNSASINSFSHLWNPTTNIDMISLESPGRRWHTHNLQLRYPWPHGCWHHPHQWQHPPDQSGSEPKIQIRKHNVKMCEFRLETNQWGCETRLLYYQWDSVQWVSMFP